MDKKNFISQYIEENQNIFTDAADTVWNLAEAGMKELKSAQCLEEALKKGGFNVKSGLAEIPTAFVGEWGSGKPIIGFLGEFDALPGLSQKPGCTVKDPLTAENGSYGHGCGHHLLGAGALGAAFALKAYFEEYKLPGTVRYYGCPGEEYGSGKTFMARDGQFDDLDACFTWHPSDNNHVVKGGSLACYSIFFKFYGKTAHAAGAPHLGRSALDACELMNVGCNYLREHIIPEARLHYAYREVGGIAPNVVQDKAELHYFVRAPRVADMMDIVDRVKDIAKGAALMTGTTVECVTHEALSDYVPNKVLSDIMQQAMLELGTPVYNESDKAEIAQFAAIITEEERSNSQKNWKEFSDEPVTGPICDKIAMLNNTKGMSGSTDVGDASYCAPTAQCNTATNVFGTPGHTWQYTAQGTTGFAHKGMLYAAKVMALSAVMAMENPKTLLKAKEELVANTDGGYKCPLPPEVKPTL